MNILTVDYNEILQPATLMKILITYMMILSITLDHIKASRISLDFLISFFKTTGEPIK